MINYLKNMERKVMPLLGKVLKSIASRGSEAVDRHGVACLLLV
jgi:hypothetical protein